MRKLLSKNHVTKTIRMQMYEAMRKIDDVYNITDKDDLPLLLEDIKKLRMK